MTSPTRLTERTPHSTVIEPRSEKFSAGIGVGAAVVAVLLPVIVNGFAFNYLLSYVVIVCILALGMHLLMGLAGVFSLGQGAMFGTGAYAAVVIIGRLGIDGIAGFILVGICGAAIGVLMGVVTLRATHLYLALTTLACGYVIENLVQNAAWLGGAQGITGFTITFGGHALDDPRVLYWVGLFFLFVLIAVILSIRRSKVGRALMATRESPIAARSIGIDTRRYTLLTFGIAGGFAAIAGGLYTAYAAVVDTSVFDLDLTLSVLTIAIVGGVRSMPGVLVVAVLLTYFRNSAEMFGVSKYVILIYGLLIVLTLRFLPGGIGGLFTSGRINAIRQLILRSNRSTEPDR